MYLSIIFCFSKITGPADEKRTKAKRYDIVESAVLRRVVNIKTTLKMYGCVCMYVCTYMRGYRCGHLRGEGINVNISS